uniref:Uncharacterized protein n=1 Tax=Heterorhabditis bacteriophora TaxID=37862 RepID=A0A1I7WXL6_HETBA
MDTTECNISIARINERVKRIQRIFLVSPLYFLISAYSTITFAYFSHARELHLTNERKFSSRAVKYLKRDLK